MGLRYSRTTRLIASAIPGTQSAAINRVRDILSKSGSMSALLIKGSAA